MRGEGLQIVFVDSPFLENEDGNYNIAVTNGFNAFGWRFVLSALCAKALLTLKQNRSTSPEEGYTSGTFCIF